MSYHTPEPGSIRFVCIARNGLARDGVYGGDDGEVYRLADEWVYQHPEAFAFTDDSPRLHWLPWNVRSLKLFEAGHKLGDYPSQPGWYYDPSRITISEIPLRAYSVGHWQFFARWLGAWGQRVWAASEPVHVAITAN